MTGGRVLRTFVLLAVGVVQPSAALGQTAEDWSVRFFVSARSDFDRCVKVSADGELTPVSSGIPTHGSTPTRTLSTPTPTW